jgi:ribosome-associated protein
LDLAHLLVDSLLDKKGSDILLLDIREHAAFADYFLICSGDNERQLKALAENVALDAKKDGDTRPMGFEGDAADGWVLIDFGDLVVHLFSPDKRAYYSLETLWDDAHVVMRMQ